MPLAVESYEQIASLGDDSECLNLAWTLDERDCLDLDLRERLQLELQDEVRGHLPYLASYFVKDPYGADHLAPALARYFGLSFADVSITCGAGVGSLLAALAGVVRGHRVEIIGETYPDFPFWVQRMGGSSDFCRGPADLSGNAAIVFLERPMLRGDIFADPADVLRLCRDVAGQATIVLIDEANANYCPPAYSAVPLVASTDNLVVVRGLSKAYGMGGLRMGYCVASRALEATVRAAVPPLQVSSLSLRLARAILELGDVTASLRQTICLRKDEARKQLARLGLTERDPANHRLPYLLFEQTDQNASLLSRAGIRVKSHPVCSADGSHQVCRLSVPLRDERAQMLQARIDGMAA